MALKDSGFAAAGYMSEVDVEKALDLIEQDASFNTGSSYSANTDAYPDHLIPFKAKHMAYLRTHPKTDPEHYLANLRLMMRIRK
jgi:hypothetical protein